MPKIFKTIGRPLKSEVIALSQERPTYTCHMITCLFRAMGYRVSNHFVKQIRHDAGIRCTVRHHDR